MISPVCRLRWSWFQITCVFNTRPIIVFRIFLFSPFVLLLDIRLLLFSVCRNCPKWVSLNSDRPLKCVRAWAPGVANLLALLVDIFVCVCFVFTCPFSGDRLACPCVSCVSARQREEEHVWFFPRDRAVSFPPCSKKNLPWNLWQRSSVSSFYQVSCLNVTSNWRHSIDRVVFLLGDSYWMSSIYLVDVYVLAVYSENSWHFASCMKL